MQLFNAAILHKLEATVVKVINFTFRPNCVAKGSSGDFSKAGFPTRGPLHGRAHVCDAQTVVEAIAHATDPMAYPPRQIKCIHLSIYLYLIYLSSECNDVWEKGRMKKLGFIQTHTHAQGASGPSNYRERFSHDLWLTAGQ